MEYFCNMALYHTGRMPYDLLKYPQNYGINSLFRLGSVTHDKAGMDIICMNNWAISTKLNAGRPKRWWFMAKRLLLS